jgi:glutathione S-transferase
MTVADLAVYPVLQWVLSSIVSEDSLRPYTRLSHLMERVKEHPKVAEYYRQNAAAVEETKVEE